MADEGEDMQVAELASLLVGRKHGGRDGVGRIAVNQSTITGTDVHAHSFSLMVSHHHHHQNHIILLVNPLFLHHVYVCFYDCFY